MRICASEQSLVARFARVCAFDSERDFPRASRRGGDIDSGPLLFGISASATVVAVRAARVNGDEALAVDLLTVIDVGGVPRERCYGLGLLPVADAFLAWARAAPSPSVGAPTVPRSPTSSWRLWWSVILSPR